MKPAVEGVQDKTDYAIVMLVCAARSNGMWRVT